MTTPQLTLWSDGERSANSSRSVVFIHGIFSDHGTFQRLRDRLEEDVRFFDYSVYYFDYDYNDSIEANGRAFASALAHTFDDKHSVSIIAHSMGGLVARLAILSRPMTFIRCLFLLGTPNLGAIRMAQVALLAQLVLKSCHVAFAVFPRRRGIVDLTKAGDIVGNYLDYAEHADGVNYISIPGLFYHERRPFWAFGQGIASKLFSALRVGLEIVRGTFPFMSVTLSLPHDGIVERVSNCLIPCDVGRESEKKDSINFRDLTKVSYAHVELDSCRKLNHLDIQSDKNVYEVVSDIILTTDANPTVPALEIWYARLTDAKRRRFVRSVQFKP